MHTFPNDWETIPNLTRQRKDHNPERMESRPGIAFGTNHYFFLFYAFITTDILLNIVQEANLKYFGKHPKWISLKKCIAQDTKRLFSDEPESARVHLQSGTV